MKEYTHELENIIDILIDILIKHKLTINEFVDFVSHSDDREDLVLVEQFMKEYLESVKSDEPRNSEPTKKKFEAFYQTNHNNPSFLPMWNYFQEMYSDKPSPDIGKIKEKYKKTFPVREFGWNTYSSIGKKCAVDSRDEVFNFFLPYLKGEK